MPVPRRFDRRPPERDPTRINERIRVREVRLVDEDGQQIGVVPTEQAMTMAQERDLDLVEVAPEASPPVARLLDYSKYKYEQEQKAKAARKHQTQVTVREIKLRPKIADHDYATKRGHVERFLKGQNKVKVTIMFRGREQAHPERGRRLLERLYEDVAELATIEQQPEQEGRNMHMILGPVREGAPRRGVTPVPARPEDASPPETDGGGPAEDPAEPAPDAPAAEEPAAEPAETAEPAAEPAETAAATPSDEQAA